MQENLRRLGDVPGFEVASGDPDVRGWGVKTQDGRRIGEVEELIVDPSARKVRYLEVGLDRSTMGLQHDRRISIPVESADVSRGDHTVIVSGFTRDAIGALPDSEYATRRSTAGEYDRAPAAASTAEGRRPVSERDTVMARSEEELRMGKRREQAGEVVVGKHVDTEHVSEPVSVERERVHVERRPVEGSTRNREGRMGDEEIRIPINEERIVVDKRPTVKEELVVSKETVTETEQVEDDLRKERFDVRREGAITEDPETRRRGGR